MGLEVYHKGEILYNSEKGTYKDQLNPELPEIHKRHFSSYIYKTYNLTTEEYYNLVVFSDKDRKVVCPVCGGIQEFNSLLYPYYKCCEGCRKQYNFNTEKDIKDYLGSVGLPIWVDEKYLYRIVNARKEVIVNSFKPSGEDSDVIMKLLKYPGAIHRSTISDLVSKGLLSSRYLNRTNLYDYLINKGFLPYEVQSIIINDL